MESWDAGLAVGLPQLATQGSVPGASGALEWDRTSRMAAHLGWQASQGGTAAIELARLHFERDDGLQQRLWLTGVRLGVATTTLEQWRWEAAWQRGAGGVRDRSSADIGPAFELGARAAGAIAVTRRLQVGIWLSATWLDWRVDTRFAGQTVALHAAGFAYTPGLQAAWRW